MGDFDDMVVGPVALIAYVPEVRSESEKMRLASEVRAGTEYFIDSKLARMGEGWG